LSVNNFTQKAIEGKFCQRYIFGQGSSPLTLEVIWIGI